MSKPPLPGSPLLRALAMTALCAFAALAPRPASAVVDCSNIRTPAVGVSSQLWGDLQPTDTGQIPAARDSTNYFGQTRPDSSYPLFTDVNIQNGYIFTSYLSGFMIWDTRPTAGDPTLLSVRDGWRSGDFPAWFLDGENRELIYGISLPDGRDDLMALAGIAPAGFSIWNTSNKASPTAYYQDLAKESNDVHAATINNRAYAFATAGNGSVTTLRGGMGVQVYDMTAAQQYTRCVDSTTATNCPGVWIGRVGQSRVVTSIDGLQTGSGKHIIAFSSGLLLKGMELWDVSNPALPQPVHAQTDRLLSTDFVGDVALWEQSGHQYLAVRVPTEGRIYDITSCLAAAGSCTSIDSSLIWRQSLANAPASNWFVTFSRSNSTPFLYFGVENFCYGPLHKEYLFNVTDPTHPVEVGTGKTAFFNDSTNTPVAVDYWGWYDVGSPTGFSNVMPRRAKFNGAYLYRMAWSIFDVHQWVGASPAPPVASFTYAPAAPAAIYPGDTVTFNDTSTGRVDTRSWTFSPDGTPGTSAVSQPAVTFATPGSKSVSLTVSNTLFPNSPSTATNNVTVLNPSPAVAAAVISPASPLVCQPVTFTANGVTGRPTLNVSWAVKDGNGNTVASGPGTGPGSSFTWSTNGTTPAGSYTGTVTVSNTSGSASQSVPVTLASLPPLPVQGSFAPTNDSFVAGTVQFHVNASGATHWTWNFGDGTAALDTSDPVAGPNPVHTYAATGPYNVTVTVSNCQLPAGVASAALPVTITQVAPLTIDVFQAVGCGFGFCQFGVNQAITFTESVSGGATSYDYDWNGDGTFEQSSPTLITTHTYTAMGTYAPVMRANRGAQSVTSTHAPIIISNVVSTPLISVSGPSTGNTGQALGFTASASNCTGTVTDSGWIWSASGGGTVSGSGASVQVTWAGTGPQTVTATNSACGSARGSAQVSIGTVNNTNSLAAAFSFSPSAPNTGDTVSFDGSASTGGPTGWLWNFGDGQTGSGAKVTHVYSQKNSYTVQLQVSKPGEGTGCSLGLCTATITKTVVVGTSFQADFTSTANCISEFGVNQCTTTAGTSVQLTANAPGATSLSWNFGDGGTATGAQVTHTWATKGTYTVVLQASNGTATATVTRPFVVNPGVTPPPNTVVLPWIAQTRGALVQSSDLYVHNPSTSPMNVTLQFRKRGLPDTNPPTASKTIAPGATLYVPDVLGGLFNQQNIAGFISLTVDQGSMAPVITSYNTTVQADGEQFGQTISGVPMGGSASAKDTTAGAPQNLVGLINNSDRLAYFGISNPGSSAVTYKLRLFDKLGNLIGQTSQDLTVAPFGQRQFQSAEIESTFGVTNQDDYRVEVTPTSSGANLVPYASNLRLASQDPSFIEAGSSSNTKSYLLGALSTLGLNNTLWQSDLLLSNVNSQAVTADVTFTGIGVNAVPTTPLHVTLQPGETQRLQNVIGSQWGINNAIGLLTIKSTSPNGIFPIVQGESYDNSHPTKRFGQSMAAMTDGDAAVSGQGQYLAGLRQDANHRTTLWLYNPGSGNGVYDLVYRNLDGTVIATTANLQLAGGKLRQISPAQLPLPTGGVQDGFTLQIVVKSGQVLSAAQVVDNGTNDPSYIQGNVR